MLTTRRAAALAMALAACVPASAGAAGVKTRTFKVEIEGRQTSKFDYAHIGPAYQCDQTGQGYGSEAFVFRTAKPAKLVAHLYGRNTVVFSGKGSVPNIHTNVRVTRDSHRFADAIDPRCEGTGGNQQGPAPDCGTARTQLDVMPGWWSRDPTGVTLQTGPVSTLDPVFRNCPVNGQVFPYLLTSTTSGAQIVSRIPAADLFDERFRKHILIGKGTFAQRDPEGGHTTTIRWSVSLTAIDDKEKS